MKKIRIFFVYSHTFFYKMQIQTALIESGPPVIYPIPFVVYFPSYNGKGRNIASLPWDDVAKFGNIMKIFMYCKFS